MSTEKDEKAIREEAWNQIWKIVDECKEELVAIPRSTVDKAILGRSSLNSHESILAENYFKNLVMDASYNK
jgi:hypothetical protein